VKYVEKIEDSPLALANAYRGRKTLERACCDYLILEDTLSEAYGSTSETYLKHALMVPQA
jgi:hypothetical protein